MSDRRALRWDYIETNSSEASHEAFRLSRLYTVCFMKERKTMTDSLILEWIS